ncbi:helix-turn-helix domain-containing protein [Parafrankia sp. FMc2]|uniref:helix-turn-helix domain-containing protein n=1 Tax=Parafrankia sp. FMc2 TaxID=3233196 RepID=UPI0034D3E6B8
MSTAEVESGVPPGLEALFARLDALPKDEFLTTPEVAELFRVKERTVGTWARTGRLAGVMISRSGGWRFSPADLKAFARRKYTAAQPVPA